MWEYMALSKQHRAHRAPVPPSVSAEIVARQVRVEQLRRIVAKGTYKVDPQRLALRILFKSFGGYSPEKRT
jgi:anti-sigma28 factor (negative regulator of flagellin synthesis)